MVSSNFYFCFNLLVFIRIKIDVVYCIKVIHHPYYYLLHLIDIDFYSQKMNVKANAIFVNGNYCFFYQKHQTNRLHHHCNNMDCKGVK